jgi:hypothetical protein
MSAGNNHALWIELVAVRADGATRELVAVGPDGVHVLQRAVLAAPSAGAKRPPAWLFSPAGVRVSLGLGPENTFWLVGRDRQGGPALVRLGADGRPIGRRQWPQGVARADFLGLAPSGLAYVLADAGTADQRLEGVTASGHVRRTRPLPPGDGPAVPHPAAMAPDGSLALLTGQSGGLHIDWYPARSVWAPGSGA